MEKSKEELFLIGDIIKYYADSPDVNRTVKYSTPVGTKKAVRDFLAGLAVDENKWKLMAFYVEVFSYFNDRPYLYLQGTGAKGFSIKLNTIKDGEISLCTLWKNLTIEFRLLR